MALALGVVSSPGRKGTTAPSAAADLLVASSRDGNGYIISDWGDFH